MGIERACLKILLGSGGGTRRHWDMVHKKERRRPMGAAARLSANQRGRGVKHPPKSLTFGRPLIQHSLGPIGVAECWAARKRVLA